MPEETTDPQLTLAELLRARDSGERTVPTVMALAGASLIGADLAGLNLSGSDLSGADLSKAIAGHHPSEEASGLSCPIAVRLAACLGEEEGQGVDELVSLARAECGLAEDRVLEVLEGATERAEELSLLFG